MGIKMLKWLEALFVSVFAIFAPIEHLLLSTGAMIMIDLVTGIMAAKKQGIPITSSGIRRTLTKMFVYESALCLAYLAEHYMSNVLPFVKMASAMITLVELTSVYENLNTISGTDLLKGLISKLGSENSSKK